MPKKACSSLTKKARKPVRESLGSNALAIPRSSPSSISSVASSTMPLFHSATKRSLRYYEKNTMATTLALLNTYIFRVNDLYDPSVTFTGHQPMGFDQMMVFYDHFTVTRAKVTCRFINRNATDAVVGLRVDGNNVATVNLETLMEAGGVVTDGLAIATTYGGSKTLSISVDIPKFHGVSPAAITASTSLTGSAGASPTDGVFVHAFVWDPTSTGALVTIETVIDFDAIFTEPRVPTPSRVLAVAQNDASRICKKKILEMEQKTS